MVVKELIHMCPPRGSGLMPCCGQAPTGRMADRITTDPKLVTCGKKEKKNG